MNRFIASNAPAATILVRLLVGVVFVSEGFQKFVFPAEVGAGRFASIGIGQPDIVAPIIGVVEIVCGTLVVLGLATRLAVVPLIATMLVAITTTKIPILLGQEFLGFALRKASYYGVWGFLHESRTDLSMLICSIFLLICGAGPISLDSRFSRSDSE